MLHRHHKLFSRKIIPNEIIPKEKIPNQMLEINGIILNDKTPGNSSEYEARRGGAVNTKLGGLQLWRLTPSSQTVGYLLRTPIPCLHLSIASEW